MSHVDDQPTAAEEAAEPGHGSERAARPKAKRAGAAGAKPRKRKRARAAGANPSGAKRAGAAGAKPGKAKRAAAGSAKPGKAKRAATGAPRPGKAKRAAAGSAKPGKAKRAGAAGAKPDDAKRTGATGAKPGKAKRAGAAGAKPDDAKRTGATGAKPGKAKRAQAAGAKPGKASPAEPRATKAERLEGKRQAAAERRAAREAEAARLAAERAAAEAARVAAREAKARAREEARREREERLAERVQRHEERVAAKEAKLRDRKPKPEIVDWAGLGDQEATADDKSVMGREGWVFLARDSNQVLKQHTGELLFDEEQLSLWQDTLEERHRWVAQRGGAFVFLVPPNPHSVYPEMLPEEIAMGEVRPVLQLIRRLEGADSPVTVVYPLEELSAVKHSELIYPKTDSHWSAYGAFVAYRAVLDRLPAYLARRTLERDEIEFEEVWFPGGLGVKVRPPIASRQIVARVRHPSATIVDDNLVRRIGRIIRFQSEQAPDVSCVLFGDSFSYALLRYLAETFRRFTFVHLPTLDRRVVEDAAADVVICSVNERFLIRVALDDEGQSAEEAAEAKRAAGLVVSPVKAGKESLKLLWP